MILATIEVPTVLEGVGGMSLAHQERGSARTFVKPWKRVPKKQGANSGHLRLGSVPNGPILHPRTSWKKMLSSPNPLEPLSEQGNNP